MQFPEKFFTGLNLENYFNQNLKHKKGGGIDNLTASKFYELYRDKFDDIAMKCLHGTYHFSCYRERLETKAKNKYPRVLSIPSMRDRLVLGVLNQYLQAVYQEKGYHQAIPNEEIRKVRKYINSLPQDSEIRFLKTDFHNYYGSIRRTILLEKLKEDIAPNMLILIENAISTPTIPHGSNSKEAKVSKHGIPQGLSISNILAYIYLKDFDENYGRKWAGFYTRYVDDILFLNPTQPNLIQTIKKNLATSRLRLKFSNSKIKEGVVGQESLDFIGYVFKADGIVSIRRYSVTNYITRIAGLAKKCVDEYNNKDIRAKLIKPDQDFISYYIDEFNLKLSGFKLNNHRYGWIYYYQAINDVGLIHGIERIIKTRIMKNVPDAIKGNLTSLVDTYHDIRNAEYHRILDFDRFDTSEKKKEFLLKKGYEVSEMDDKSIDFLFNRYLKNLIKQTELTIGRIS